MRIEYEVGERMGSMPKRERRIMGVEVEIIVGSVLCRSVMGRSEVGQKALGRSRTVARTERGPCDVGVRIRLLEGQFRRCS